MDRILWSILKHVFSWWFAVHLSDNLSINTINIFCVYNFLMIHIVSVLLQLLNKGVLLMPESIQILLRHFLWFISLLLMSELLCIIINHSLNAILDFSIWFLMAFLSSLKKLQRSWISTYYTLSQVRIIRKTFLILDLILLVLI